MTPRELALRRTIPVVINSYNQFSYLRSFIDDFWAQGFRNLYVVDNASTHAPLLAYYEELLRSQQAMVVYYNQNRGPHHFFTASVHRHLFEGAPFLYSDPDLHLPDMRDDLLSHWFDLSRRFRIFKVGSALTIPAPHEHKNPDLRLSHEGQSYSLPEWEAQFWRHPVAPQVYSAPIDTTLHLFNTELYTPGSALITGLRVAGPGFEAIHRPWFLNDPCPADEMAYYRRDATYTNWT